MLLISLSWPLERWLLLVIHSAEQLEHFLVLFSFFQIDIKDFGFGNAIHFWSLHQVKIMVDDFEYLLLGAGLIGKLN